MTLWLLERDGDYDEFVGFAVLAPDEPSARRLAFDASGDVEYGHDSRERQWLDSKQSTCVPVPVEGGARVVLSSFRAG